MQNTRMSQRGGGKTSLSQQGLWTGKKADES